VGWIAASVLLIALVVLSFVQFREARPQARTLRYTIAPPENLTVQSFAISPDGRYIVLAGLLSGKQQLWLRPLDGLQFRPCQAPMALICLSGRPIAVSLPHKAS
jgi:hypothetical protein